MHNKERSTYDSNENVLSLVLGSGVIVAVDVSVDGVDVGVVVLVDVDVDVFRVVFRVVLEIIGFLVVVVVL